MLDHRQKSQRLANHGAQSQSGSFKENPDNDTSVELSSVQSPPCRSTPWMSPSRLCSGSVSSNDSISSNGIGDDNLTPGQVLSMNMLFREHFDSFHGSPWSLPSGAIVDDCLREIVEGLPYESALHSFVIEDVDTLLELFDAPGDREVIERVLVTRADERLPALSPAERSFLEQYVMPPNDLYEYVMDHGCRHAGSTLQEKPSEEFMFMVHNCIAHVLLAYRENECAFPVDSSVAWFTLHLWGFLRIALSCRRTLWYKPGEVSSEASARRRNKRHTGDGQQIHGHKVDGMVVIPAHALEICYIVAGENDRGTNTNRLLDDTRKLFKLMKDAHDMIRERTIRDIGKQLVTFGLRISGPTMTVFTLRQRPGRFYQAASEVTVSFPAAWVDHDDTRIIIGIISWVMRLRKAILAMATSTKTWVSEGFRSSGDPRIGIIPTMTSPCLLSTPVASPDVPPLAI
ncbi:hypothetical protein BGW41_004162 [Actinomortierella wolfii]|nr:hypothetical protein BGW41_004162 [Actinomortierella wolfii]